MGVPHSLGDNEFDLFMTKIEETNWTENALHRIFIDFTKAFNTVNKEALWYIQQKLELSDYFDRLMSVLHTRMKASASLRKLSQPFQLQKRVEQIWIFALTPFSVLLSMVLSYTFINSTQGEYIQSIEGINLYNVRQFKSDSKTRNILARQLMFADDTAFRAHNH